MGRPWSRRKNLVNTRGRSSAGMPSPVSRTATATAAAVDLAGDPHRLGAAVLGGVLDEVGEHLLDLVGIGVHAGQVGGNTTVQSSSGMAMPTFSTTERASGGRSTICRRSTSRPVSSRLMSSSSVTSRVTRSASWWTCSSIVRFCSSLSRSQRLSISDV